MGYRSSLLIVQWANERTNLVPRPFWRQSGKVLIVSCSCAREFPFLLLEISYCGFVTCTSIATNFPTKGLRSYMKADFHSVQNVARSTFSERFLLNYKQSSGTNLISCGWLHTFQKKALAKYRSRDILHWMEIRLNYMLFNNYSPKAKWLLVNIHRDEVEVNIYHNLWAWGEQLF